MDGPTNFFYCVSQWINVGNLRNNRQYIYILVKYKILLFNKKNIIFHHAREAVG